MEYEFLRRLFASCGEKGSGVLGDGLNMSELYESIEETDRNDRAFTKLVEGTGLDFEQKSELEYACCYVGNAYELQGFINGFRLCGMLQGETRVLPVQQAQDTAFTVELLEAIMETDSWSTKQLNDPRIQEAQEALSAALEALGGDSDERVYTLVSVAYQYADAVTMAAILYGIHVADALRGGQMLPAAVSVGT